jgi:amino acid permease
MTIILLLNNSVGSWILGVPASFKGPGIVPGLIIIFLLTLLSRVNSFTIQRMAIRTGTEGLEDMIGRIFGPVGTKICGICSVALFIVVHLSYILVGTETIMKWIALDPSIDQGVWWFRPACTFGYAIIPIACTIPPEISFLGKLMPLSLGSMILLFIGLSARSIIDFVHVDRIPATDNLNLWTFTAGDLFMTLAVHSGTMTLPGAQSAPLKAYVRDIRRQESVITMTYVAAYLIYCVPSALIYLDVGNDVKSDVLMSFDPHDWIIIIIQIGVFLKVTMAFAGVHMIYQIWVSQLVWGTVKPPTASRRAVLMIITYVVVLAAANFLTDLLPVLGIGGSLGLLSMYVMPPLAELKEGGWRWKTRRGVFDVVLAIIGVFAIVVSSIFSIKSAVDFFKNRTN